jgi:cellobiose phosphorylase
MDRPGRYIYIRDSKSGEYFSPSWQPVMKDLDSYECRVGMGYSTITGSYKGVTGEVTYFVPLGESRELWVVKVRNNSGQKKKLQVFTYAEFCFYDAVTDQQDVDWAQQINQSYFDKKYNSIFFYSFMRTQGYSYFASNGKVSSYDTDLEKYVGRYRSESNPIAVEKGACSNSVAFRGNSVGGTCNEIELADGEETEIVFQLGVCQKPEDAYEQIKYYQKSENAAKAFADVNRYWKNFVSKIQVKTPDADMNLMLNLWNQYQCKSTFNWSRFVSMYQLGIRRGMGFRDSAQDILGVMHTIPAEAKELIIKLLKNQFITGDAYHQYFPLTGEGDGKGYSDDHLWIILSVTSYIKETGDYSLLDEQVPYADKAGVGSVFEHLQKAVNFSLTNVGPHGIPKMGFADWNDTLNFDRGKGNAESVWVGQFLCYCILEMIELCKQTGKNDLIAELQQNYEKMAKNINEHAWDGEWYIRAFDDDCNPIGSHKTEKGKILINSQSWSVLSKIAEGKRATDVLNVTKKMMNTKYGLMCMFPGYTGWDEKKGGVTTYPPGAKENAGIFCHTNPWMMIAETMLGRGDQAFEYYKQSCPLPVTMISICTKWSRMCIAKTFWVKNILNLVWVATLGFRVPPLGTF